MPTYTSTCAAGCHADCCLSLLLVIRIRVSLTGMTTTRVAFVLSTEVSDVYEREWSRPIHAFNLVLSLEAMEYQSTAYLPARAPVHRIAFCLIAADGGGPGLGLSFCCGQN
jgi:hypothetical protein